MKYTNSIEISKPFEQVLELVEENLASEGFGILTKINVKETLKNKLNVNFKNYVILGACNPPFAYKALQAEERIGVMLPCNVVVIGKTENQTEVAAINPLHSIASVENKNLYEIADEINLKLKKVLEKI